jgi:ABC-2 type transport system permease protein
MSKAASKAAKVARVEKPGVIRDRGYQPYTGAYTPQAGRWALITRRMLRLAVPQWWVILIIVGAALRLLGGALVVWFVTKTMGLVPPGTPVDQMPNPDNSVLGIIVDGTGTLVLSFMLALFIGGGAIADDARVGAFQFYFARPVTKTQYLVGKLVPVLVLVGSITIGPGVLLALLRIALLPTGDEALHKLPIALAAIATGAIVTVVLSLPALALSATSSRRGYVQGAYATLFVLPWLLGGIFAASTRSPWANILSLPAHLANVGQYLFRMPHGDRALPVWVSGLVLAAVVVGAFVWLRRRLEDIEVVQGS